MNVEFNSLSRMMALEQVFIVVLIRNYRSDNKRWFYDGSENIHQYASEAHSWDRHGYARRVERAHTGRVINFQQQVE